MKFTRSLATGALALMILAGCSAAEEGQEEVEEPTLTTEEAWEHVFHSQEPTEAVELPVREQVSEVQSKVEDLSPGERIDVIDVLAEETAKNFTEEEASEYTAEMFEGITESWLIDNGHEEYLLRQVLLGATLDAYYEDGTFEDEFAVKFRELAEELYRDPTAYKSESVKTKFAELQEMSEDVDYTPIPCSIPEDDEFLCFEEE